MPKISDLPADTAPASTDLIPFVDVDAARTESVTVANLAASSAFAGQYATPEVYVWAAQLGSANGSPSLASNVGPAAFWLLDPTAFEAMVGTVVFPASWTTYDVDVIWANASSSSGNVDWEFFPSNGITEGAEPTLGSALPASGAQAAPTTVGLAKFSTLATSLSVPTGGVMGFKIARRGSDAGDTVANDVRLFGLRFTNPT